MSGPAPSGNALERAAERGPEAADLLCLCAFVSAPHPLPVSVLAGGGDALPERLAAALRDPARAERLFDALLEAGAGGVSRGELILGERAVAQVRQELDADARRNWAAAAAGLLERVFPGDPCRDDTRAEAERLLPHALAAAGHAQRNGGGLAAAAQLFHLAGRLQLEVHANALEARSLLERGVAARASAHGDADARVAFDLGYLNGALLHLGEWHAMAANAVRAANILEQDYGPRDRTVITHVNNAALLLARAGDALAAAEWFERALGLAEPVFGRVHPFCATILCNLGDLQRQAGDIQAGIGCYGRALAIDQVAYGTRHESVARDLARLGAALLQAGDAAAARPHLERALEWTVAAYGEHDPRAAQLRTTLDRLSPPA